LAELLSIETTVEHSGFPRGTVAQGIYLEDLLKIPNLNRARSLQERDS